MPLNKSKLPTNLSKVFKSYTLFKILESGYAL